MAHHHDHGHSHRDPNEVEAPLDAANQSLADALRASFRVLKLIMLVLVLLFLLSGIQFIDNSEEAVVVRFGALKGGVRGPGALFALPFPVEETVRVPVNKDNELYINDQFIHLRESEKDRPLSSLSHGALDPLKDGALMTADEGLVHVRWRLVYRIDNLLGFVEHVADGGTEQAEMLLRAVLDNAAIAVAASKYTAEEITRNKAGEMAETVRGVVNERLARLGTGIRVVSLEIPESTVPLPTLAAFQAVSSAENQKQKRIREAKQKRDSILNSCAGESYRVILETLDRMESAKQAGDQALVERYREEVNALIERSGGEVGERIFEAKSYYTEAVQGIEADQEEYDALMDEYLRAPDLLRARLWAETKRKIFGYEELLKYYLPPGQKEVRVVVGPDPQQQRIDEMKRIRKEEEQKGRQGH